MKNETLPPWKFLDEFRGRSFAGEWPTLPELFALSAERFPDRACFTVYEPGRVSLSYAEALARARRVAGFIRSRGIGRGGRVAVTGKNSPEWAVAYLAALFAGAVVVPIDYQLSVVEIANLVKAGGASLLFSDEEKADKLRSSCPGLRGYYSLAAGGEGYIYSLGAASSADSVSSGAGDMPREEDLAAILFTSGTMGNPKGVMLSHKNLVSDCFLAQANLPIYHTDVFYALLPIHHSYTMLAVLIEAISVGAEIVFGKRMVIKQVLKDLKEARITMFLGVPLLFNKVLTGILKAVREKGIVVYALIRILMTLSGLVKKLTGINPGKRMFHSLLDKASLATIRICISGGGPLAPSVFRLYNQLGIDFVQGYGLTETSPILTLNPTDAYIETSVGRIIPGLEMKILEPDENGVGEIVVKGPMVMSGYYQMPEETAEVFTEDGWFRTGDLGYLDGGGYVYLTGRAKNLIVTEGGKNVFPEEIENRFQLFDEVEQVLVRGYLENEKTKSEGIEALLYPSAERFPPRPPSPEAGASGAAGAAAGTGAGSAAVDWEAAEARLRRIVDEVNQKLLPYQRIAKVTVLRQRMEETTTRKVKRHRLGA